jgi:bidirectional [NiFe] hydrogenase diaphorase subunit
VVEVKGVPRLLPACATRIAEGMEIQTDTARLQQHRRKIIELLFAERNHVCAICVSNGRCELQALAVSLGVTHTRYRYRFHPYPIDASHPRFVHDPNRCVLCARCVRVCAEVEGARTWNVKQRGIHAVLTTDLDAPWGESDSCTSCGKCVHVCPTGALFEKGKSTGEMNKRGEILHCLAERRLNFR